MAIMNGNCDKDNYSFPKTDKKRKHFYFRLKLFNTFLWFADYGIYFSFQALTAVNRIM